MAQSPSAAGWPGGSYPSSLLGATYALLRLGNGEEGASHFLATLGITIHPSVLDTNILMRDIKYRLTHGRTTALVAAASLGSLRLFASVAVRDEVPEHLGDIVTKYGISLEQALNVWEQEYVPQMLFVDPAEVPAKSQEVQALKNRDADDVPTALLIELLKPESAFSDDKDLAAFGAIGKDTAVFACAYYALAKKDSLAAEIPVGMMVVLNITGPLVEGAWSALHWGFARLDRRLVWGVVIVVGLLLLVGFTQPRFRNWLAERAEDARDVVKQGIEAMQQIHQDAAVASETLARLPPVPVPQRPARGYVAYVLARAPGPLSVAAITRRMQALGYVSRSAHPERHVGQVLRTHPRLFERVERGQWRLRSHRGRPVSHNS